MQQLFAYVTIDIVPFMPVVFGLVMISQIILGSVRRIGKKPVWQVYPAGTIEIGLSQYDPTVTLLGIVRAQHTDLFITKINLNVQCLYGYLEDQQK